MKMSVGLLSIVVAACIVSGAEAQTSTGKLGDLLKDSKPQPTTVPGAPNYITLSRHPDYLVLQRALTTATAPSALQQVYTLPRPQALITPPYPSTLPRERYEWPPDYPDYLAPGRRQATATAPSALQQQVDTLPRPRALITPLTPSTPRHERYGVPLNYPDYLVLGRKQAATPAPSTLSNQPNNATPPPSLSSIRMPTEGESLAVSFGAYKTFRAGQTMTIEEMTTEMIANGAERTFAQETAPLALRMISSSPVRGASAVIAVAAGAWAIYEHFIADDAKTATTPGAQPIAK